MGLTIHYNLNTSLTKSRDVFEIVGLLHRQALNLPFKECDNKLLHLMGEDCDFNINTIEENRWLLIQACQSIVVDNFHYHVSPDEIFAFYAWPGVGCEAMNIGLCHYPEYIYSNGNNIKTGLNGWSWQSFCKTQYASNVGMKHFLHCHNLVCVLLDIAKNIGLSVKVSDEGGFYENRDFETLAKEVGEWNIMIASFAGVLKDTIGEKGALVCPITDHPEFEHIEAKGSAYTENIQRLLEASKDDLRQYKSKNKNSR